ncbi:uncharacterized protein [Clytia hemisphaerica]|uniref:Uncharacterized protein n=1 Tax=Clytia hemisphaerica TaxID=252671 RepID=A0A7M5UAV8_9CNID
MDIEKAKETLKKLHHSIKEDGSLASIGDDFLQTFAQDLDKIEDDVPFRMLFVQQNGRIINAAIIQDDILKSLTESDTEAQQILEKFKSTNDSEVSFEEMGTFVYSPGTKVKFGHKNVYNVHGTVKDKRYSPWLLFWEDYYNKTATKCYIEKPDSRQRINQKHTTPLKLVGGHMEKKHYDNWWYILSICVGHNSKKFDRNGSSGKYMETLIDARAVQIKPIKL